MSGYAPFGGSKGRQMLGNGKLQGNSVTRGARVRCKKAFPYYVDEVWRLHHNVYVHKGQ